MNVFVEYGPLLLSRRYFRSSRVKKRSFFHREWQNIFVLILMVAGIVSGFATYAALSEAPPFGNSPNTVIWLLNFDLIILLLLVAVIANKIVTLWSGRKRGLAGSHLHVRLVYTFSILAAAPAIIMTVFSAYFFHFGVQTWFSQRIQTAINESQAVAEAYLQEHKQVIRADTLAMANDLDRQSIMLIGNPSALERLVQTQSVLRNLSEVIVFDSSGRVLARSDITFSLEFEEIPQFAMDQARFGDVVIMTGENDDRVRALVKLNGFVDSYLYAGRMVDPKVLSHLSATKEASKSYTDLQERYSDLQVTVNMIFVVVGLLLVFVAIWFGLMLARQLVAPIGALISASDRVRAGDLSTRVEQFDRIEEFDYLGRAFNRMTRQIEEQQNELIRANRQLDRRRRLTETVLEGVSAGIVGLDQEGVINLANSSAAELLGMEQAEISGKSVTDLFPDVAGLLKEAYDKPHKITQGEIVFLADNADKKIFLLRIAVELVGEKEVGAILTFDDITELQSAQRKAAWADVARRIAHEIKNPLTPIQLSAERLNRRYLKQITDKPEVFSQCIDTIIKHVGDIGHMVNEFSSFARMPEPVIKRADIVKLVKDIVVLQQQAHESIKIDFASEQNIQEAQFDAHLMRQALINLIQNSLDSIAQAEIENGRISILIGRHEEFIFISVNDNGPGFPEGESVNALTEPYVTHKPKGTGLGLAIVKKIMEDHGGQLLLGSHDWLRGHKSYKELDGATVTLLLAHNLV
ncbi:MAG: ATP-binding protein [Alphaproteobacteria bacterium]